MKFKYLIIAFSVIIIFILLMTAMLPVLTSASSDVLNFRYFTFPLFIFMILTLICLWIFFLFNYRLLSLLEREDWPALAYYLEQKIFVKGNYSSRLVKLLASSYMVISDYQSILKLETKAALAKPAVISKNILIFGVARILSRDYADAAVFFKTHLEKVKVKERDWVRWFHGFSHLLNGSFNLAEPEFLALAQFSDDAIITALSAYFLSNNLVKYSKNPNECMAAAGNGETRVVKALKNAGGWKKEVDRVASNIHITIIRKYIDEAGTWLFGIKV